VIRSTVGEEMVMPKNSVVYSGRYRADGGAGQNIGSVTGACIKRSMANRYEFIVNYYEPGDRIFPFGLAALTTPVRRGLIGGAVLNCQLP
jgi:uncharacterized protein (DUF2235 family)